MDELTNNKLDIIPFDAMMSIKVSGAFYQRLQNNLFAVIREKEHDPELTAILKELESREPNNLWEEHVTAYLALIYAIDEAATSAGLVIKQDYSDQLPGANPSQEASPES